MPQTAAPFRTGAFRGPSRGQENQHSDQASSDSCVFQKEDIQDKLDKLSSAHVEFRDYFPSVPMAFFMIRGQNGLRAQCGRENNGGV
jgi:hypothetical protein